MTKRTAPPSFVPGFLKRLPPSEVLMERLKVPGAVNVSSEERHTLLNGFKNPDAVPFNPASSQFTNSNAIAAGETQGAIVNKNIRQGRIEAANSMTRLPNTTPYPKDDEPSLVVAAKNPPPSGSPVDPDQHGGQLRIGARSNTVSLFDVGAPNLAASSDGRGNTQTDNYFLLVGNILTRMQERATDKAGQAKFDATIAAAEEAARPSATNATGNPVFTRVLEANKFGLS